MAAPIGPLWDLARSASDREQSAYQSWSGADVAEAPVWGCVRDVYVVAAQGGDVEAAIVAADAKWRRYAAENNAKIAAAPKLKRGPSAGHSSIGHRYTSPELFASKLPHIRYMVRPRAEGE